MFLRAHSCRSRLTFFGKIPSKDGGAFLCSMVGIKRLFCMKIKSENGIIVRLKNNFWVWALYLALEIIRIQRFFFNEARDLRFFFTVTRKKLISVLYK